MHENVRALPYYHFVESEDIAREGHDLEAYRNVELIFLNGEQEPRRYVLPRGRDVKLTLNF